MVWKAAKRPEGWNSSHGQRRCASKVDKKGGKAMISAKRRMEVLKLYFEGLSYDEISKAARISKGS
jgi:DNA-binding NarL/FixJ family response regulator